MRNVVKEYRLMYLFGAWITKVKIYAESDEEAIYDSDEIFNRNKTIQSWKMGVALVQENRFVKRYI